MSISESDINRFAFYRAPSDCGIGQRGDGRWVRRPAVMQVREASDQSLARTLSSVASGMERRGQSWEPFRT